MNKMQPNRRKIIEIEPGHENSAIGRSHAMTGYIILAVIASIAHNIANTQLFIL